MADQDELKINIVTTADTKAARDAAKALDDLKTKTLENTEKLKADRQARESVIDVTKRHTGETGKLAEATSKLGVATEALNRYVPGLGSALKALTSPYTAIAVAIGWLIKKNIDLRQEYKAFLAEADKNSQESLAKIQANISAHTQAVNTLKVALLNAGDAARNLSRDLSEYLGLTSAEESAALEILGAKEQMEVARAEKELANDPAALAERKGAIKLGYAQQRFDTKQSYQDQRLALREGQIAKMAADETSAKQRAVELAAGLGAKPDVAAQMASYDALVAAAEQEREQAGKVPWIGGFDPKKYKSAIERHQNLKRRRPEVEAQFQQQAANWEQRNADAQAAEAFARSLPGQRQTLEREADMERIRLGIDRPAQTTAHNLGQETIRFGTGTESDRIRGEAASRQSRAMEQQSAAQQRRAAEALRSVGAQMPGAANDVRELAEALRILLPEIQRLGLTAAEVKRLAKELKRNGGGPNSRLD